ncbi:MAG: hypothetical protein WCO06_06850 [Candidatus Roizmanbacteria bacterium]
MKKHSPTTVKKTKTIHDYERSLFIASLILNLFAGSLLLWYLASSQYDKAILNYSLAKYCVSAEGDPTVSPKSLEICRFMQ